MAYLEPPEHALGRHRALDWQHLARTDRWKPPSALPADMMNRYFSRNGLPMACSILFRIAAVGGIFTGWMNGEQLSRVCEMEAEFGMPQWGFGMSSYAFESAERIVCTYIENGISRLALIDTRTKKFEPIDLPLHRHPVCASGVEGTGAGVMRAGSPTEAAAIVRFDLETRTIRSVAPFQQSGD